MEFYLLRPVEKLEASDNPWEPWYDKCFGFVVLARNEKDARTIAHQNGADENSGVRRWIEGKAVPSANTTAPWRDPKYTSCKPLSAAKFKRGVIIRDDHAA